PCTRNLGGTVGRCETQYTLGAALPVDAVREEEGSERRRRDRRRRRRLHKSRKRGKTGAEKKLERLGLLVHPSSSSTAVTVEEGANKEEGCAEKEELCSRCGQPKTWRRISLPLESPLSVLLCAGNVALPRFMQLLQVVSQQSPLLVPEPASPSDATSLAAFPSSPPLLSSTPSSLAVFCALLPSFLSRNETVLADQRTAFLPPSGPPGQLPRHEFGSPPLVGAEGLRGPPSLAGLSGRHGHLDDSRRRPCGDGSLGGAASGGAGDVSAAAGSVSSTGNCPRCRRPVCVCNLPQGRSGWWAAAAGFVGVLQNLGASSSIATAAPSSPLLSSGGMLALELDLGPAFHFHSKFSCAVSREQTSCNNPPVLLSCGHTIC
ncbi:zinc c3hc4 type (ring finger) domain-containing, partial [Cystoisospora suis]